MDLKPLLDALAKKGSDVHIINIEGVAHAAVPAGVALQRIDLEPYLPAPTAIRRDVLAHDLRGLIAYVNKFKNEATQLYADPINAPSIIARLDDHMPHSPSHVSHTAKYPCPRTAEWNTWNGGNKIAKEQKSFADFLETNLRDIHDPNGAEMLQMATNFRDVSTAEFQSNVNRTSGRVQFQYVQKDSSTGQVQLPDTFKIAVPVFEGMDTRYVMLARLRWRLKEQVLSLWYELDRPDVTFRLAFDELVERVENEIGVDVFRAV